MKTIEIKVQLCEQLYCKGYPTKITIEKMPQRAQRNGSKCQVSVDIHEHLVENNIPSALTDAESQFLSMAWSRY